MPAILRDCAVSRVLGVIEPVCRIEFGEMLGA